MAVENALVFLRGLDGKRTLPDTMVVFGPHPFLREFVVNAVVDRLSRQGFKYRSYQIGATGDFATVLEELRAPDLFAPKRLIACRFLKSHRDRGGDESGDDIAGSSGRKGAAGGESALAEVVEGGAAPNQLLLVFERDTVPARIRKAAEKSAAMVGCMRPFDNQLSDYVQAIARIQGLKLAPGTANFLVERHAGDLATIANALDKAGVMAESGKPIGPDDLEEPGARKMPEVFEIADNLARGRTARALGQIDRALALGRDPIEILAVEVIPVMRRMMIAAAMLARRRSSGEIAAAIGASPASGLVTRAIEGARRLGLEALRKGYARATELDESFKNGTIKDREQALGGLLLELMTPPTASHPPHQVPTQR
jgi:DNA polymerase III delta subunit